MSTLPEDQDEVRRSLERDEVSLEQNVEEVTELWSQVSGISQEYFNHCLNTNFGPLWSINRTACINMRKRLVDPYTLVAQGQKDIHRLKYRLVLVGSEQRGLALKAASTTLSQATRNRNNTRIAELVNEEQDIRSQLFPLQRDMALRQEKLQQSQRNAIHDLIQPFLSSIGRLPQPRRDSQSSSGAGEGTTRPSASLGTDGSPRSTLPAPRSPDVELDREPTAEDLIRRYRIARDGLEALQRRLGLEQISLRGVFNEVDHILTFTNLSPERYAAFAARCSSTGARLLSTAEEDFFQARDDLLAAGGEVPADSRRSDNGSRRTTDSSRIRNLNRRRVNDYRFSQRPFTSASISPRSRRSIPEFGTENTRDDVTAGLTSSPGRDQTLQEYRREQDLMRRQEERRRDESMRNL